MGKKIIIICVIILLVVIVTSCKNNVADTPDMPDSSTQTPEPAPTEIPIKHPVILGRIEEGIFLAEPPIEEIPEDLKGWLKYPQYLPQTVLELDSFKKAKEVNAVVHVWRSGIVTTEDSIVLEFFKKQENKEEGHLYYYTLRFLYRPDENGVETKYEITAEFMYFYTEGGRIYRVEKLYPTGTHERNIEPGIIDPLGSLLYYDLGGGYMVDPFRYLAAWPFLGVRNLYSDIDERNRIVHTYVLPNTEHERAIILSYAQEGDMITVNYYVPFWGIDFDEEKQRYFTMAIRLLNGDKYEVVSNEPIETMTHDLLDINEAYRDLIQFWPLADLSGG